MRHCLLWHFLTAMLVWTAAAPAAGLADDRPNLVLIISDDHDYEHLGFMGHEAVRTPTLDRLAAAGTVFTTAHLPMSRCHPTLASFLSGRWPHQTGIYYNYGSAVLEPRDSLPNSSGMCSNGGKPPAAANSDCLDDSRTRYDDAFRLAPEPRRRKGISYRHSRLSLRERACFRGAKGDTYCLTASNGGGQRHTP